MKMGENLTLAKQWHRQWIKECEVCSKKMNEHEHGWKKFMLYGRCKKCQMKLIKLKSPYNN